MQETGGALKSWEEPGDEVDTYAHRIKLISLLACMQEYIYNITDNICFDKCCIWLVMSLSQPPLVAKTAGITKKM